MTKLHKSQQNLQAKWTEIESIKKEMQIIAERKDEIRLYAREELEEGEVPNEMINNDLVKTIKQE
jgi:hypothetical protein